MGCDIHGFVEVNEFGEWWEPYVLVGGVIGRNYTIFSILADVRNHDEFKPISPPKGFPEDAGCRTKNDYEEWKEDSHSATHLTFKEIKDFDYNQEVDSDYLFEVNQKGEVLSVCRSLYINGKDLTHGDTYENEKGELITIEKRKRTLNDELSESKSWNRLLRLMEVLSEDFSDERVRIVIWFDN